MIPESLLDRDWQDIVRRLSGAEAIEASLRETKAFQRPRVIGSALDLLRMTLAYRLRERGLRLTAAWGRNLQRSAAYRLGQCRDWLTGPSMIRSILVSS